jgi:hypothetical protein
MSCDKKSLLAGADASKQRNLMVVGGHSDNAVDLCEEDNADGKRQCLADNADVKRQCLGVKSPSETRFERTHEFQLTSYYKRSVSAAITSGESYWHLVPYILNSGAGQAEAGDGGGDVTHVVRPEWYDYRTNG